MDSKLATAFLLKDWTVYGYRLKPFCLLHSLQLEAIESPVIGSGPITNTDILLAAQICSQYDPLTVFRKSWLRTAFRNHDYQASKLFTYLAESKSRPDLREFDRSEAGGSPLNSPWQLSVVTLLMRKANMSWRYAWTMPEGQAMWAFYSVREQESDKSDIYSEDEQRADAERLANTEMQEAEKRRGKNLGLYHKGLWPDGVKFDLDATLPDLEYSKLEEIR